MTYEFASRIGLRRVSGEWLRIHPVEGITAGEMRMSDPAPPGEPGGQLVPEILPRMDPTESVTELPPVRRLVLLGGRRHVVSDALADELREAGYGACLREPPPEPQVVERTHVKPLDLNDALNEIDALKERLAAVEARKK